MDTDFWIEKWQQRQIGFHEGRPNASLQQWFDALALQPGDHVFVPLCGKSQDLLWLLGKGLQVTGCECSPQAVAEFFSDNQLQYEHCQDQTASGHTVFQCGRLSLWQGDFFRLPEQVLASADGVYDRAALIALPPDLRQRYVHKFYQELTADTPILLVTLDFQRDPALSGGYQGPPFPHTDDMVKRQYQAFSRIDKLGERDILANEPKFQAQGATSAYEKTWLVTR